MALTSACSSRLFINGGMAAHISAFSELRRSGRLRTIQPVEPIMKDWMSGVGEASGVMTPS
jgi:hypothetical protein